MNHYAGTSPSPLPVNGYKTILEKIGSGTLKKLYEKPVFIISAPRSGSTLLFESLSKHQDFWTLGQECHTIYRAISSLDPAVINFNSGALTKKQADSETANLVRAGFTMYLRNHNFVRFLNMAKDVRPRKIHFLEKTPRNSLNIPFLNKIFPDAHYIFLMRDAAPNISSIIEAWEVGLQDGSFITFENLQGWDLKHWCMLLPEGWRKLNGRSLAEIAAFQWQNCNETIMKDLQTIPANRKTYIRYENLIANPDDEIQRLLRFCKVKPNKSSALAYNELSISKTTISAPSADKWKKRFGIIEPLLFNLEKTSAKLNSLHLEKTL